MVTLSPIVVGLALMLVYSGRTGWFGPTLESWGFRVIFSTPGIILATAFVSLPLVIREVVPVLEEIGTEQEQAAQSLGAGGWQTFRRITLPSIKWAVIYGVVLTLARSLGEFGATILFAGNGLGRLLGIVLAGTIDMFNASGVVFEFAFSAAAIAILRTPAFREPA